jgi:hypothetical protein
MQSFLFPCYLVHIGPKFLQQRPTVEDPQHLFLSQCERPDFSRKSPLTSIYCRDTVTMHFVHPCFISAIYDDSFTCSFRTVT